MIEYEINDQNNMRIFQTPQDKIRYGISVERICNDEVIDKMLISESSFTNLINYYNFIMDNDIQHDFINPTGLNDEQDYEKDRENYFEPKEIEELER